jgi:glutamine phosphoribosylpyrophosphate amidotransferase
VYQVHHLEELSVSDVWQGDISDTELVANLIATQVDAEQTTNILSKSARVMSTLINAEFAFVILTASAVYDGRDPFGRRPLLIDNTARTTSQVQWQLDYFKGL